MSNSDNSVNYIKRWLHPDHPKALEFSQQCFRLRIVAGLEPFMKESFLTNPVIKDDIIAAVNDVECKGWVFTIDKENKAHDKCAVLAEEVMFWGYDKDWEGKMKATDATKFAVSRADGEMEKLRWEFVEYGDTDPEWEAMQAFDYESFSRARPVPRGFAYTDR